MGGGVVQPGAGLSTQIISLRSFTAAKAEASTSRAPDAGGRGDYPSGRLAAADTDPDGHRPQLPYQHPRTKGRGHADAPPPKRIMQAASQPVSPSAALGLRLGLVTS